MKLDSSHLDARDAREAEILRQEQQHSKTMRFCLSVLGQGVRCPTLPFLDFLPEKPFGWFHPKVQLNVLP